MTPLPSIFASEKGYSFPAEVAFSVPFPYLVVNDCANVGSQIRHDHAHGAPPPPKARCRGHRSAITFSLVLERRQ
jgi:hypothetical protein